MSNPQRTLAYLKSVCVKCEREYRFGFCLRNHLGCVHRTVMPKRTPGVHRPESDIYEYVRRRKDRTHKVSDLLACSSCWFHTGPDAELIALARNIEEYHLDAMREGTQSPDYQRFDAREGDLDMSEA